MDTVKVTFHLEDGATYGGEIKRLAIVHEAMEKFLSGPDLAAFGGEGRLPTRQEIYDERIDELVRRYEHSNLRDR